MFQVRIQPQPHLVQADFLRETGSKLPADRLADYLAFVTKLVKVKTEQEAIAVASESRYSRSIVTITKIG